MNNGAFGENFPYSNFHDLNLDWIIKVVKDFLDKYVNMEEEINNRVLKPIENPNGNYGDLLVSMGDGNTFWSSNDRWAEFIQIAVDTWLDEHPEATTTVEDNSILRTKLNTLLIENLIFSYKTLEELQEDEALQTNTFAITHGYHTLNDYGSAIYYITDEEPATYYEELANNLYAVLVYSQNLCAEVFGAYGDGTHDDYNALYNCSRTGKVILTKGKTYAIGTELTLNPPIIIEGNDATIIPLSTLPCIINADYVYNLHIDGNSTETRFGILHQSSHNAEYKNCEVRNIYCSDDSAVGIFINDNDAQTSVIIEDCIVHDIISEPDGTVGQGAGASSGIGVYAKSQVLINHNKIYNLPIDEDSTGIGIYNKESDTICKITNNIIRNVHNDGIKNEKIGTVIEGNTIYLDGDTFKTTYGIRNLVSDVEIRNNYIDGGDYTGALHAIVITLDYNATNCIVDHNIIVAPHAMTHIIIRSSDTIISNMVLASDATSTNPNNSLLGIEGSHNTIQNMTITPTGTVLAISINGDNHVFMSNNITGDIQTSYVNRVKFFNNKFTGNIRSVNTITDCVFENNVMGTLLIGATAKLIKIINNTFTDEDQNYSIALTGSFEKIIIANNIMQTKASGIVASGSTELLVTGNIFTQDTMAIVSPYGTKKIITSNMSASGTYNLNNVTNLVNQNNL